MEWISGLESIGNAALRSLAVALLLRLGIAVLRITNPHQEKIIWTTMLAGALVMPALLRWSWVPALVRVQFSAPTVVVRTLALAPPHSLAYEVVLCTLYAAIASVLLVRLGIGIRGSRL